jgi:HSP20 family protein
MAMERRHPLESMMSLRQAMDRLLQDAVVRGSSGMGSAEGPDPFPMDVAETTDAFLVRAPLPGVNPGDVQITVQGTTLVIQAQSQAEEEHEDQQWLLRERRAQSFQRAVELPAPVDVDRAEADYEAGVLTLTLPKSEAAKPRQIQIRESPGEHSG